MASKSQSRTTLRAAAMLCIVFGVSIVPATAQQTTLEVPSFLLTNRTIYGLTARLDIGLAIPFVRVTLPGERLDMYRGLSFFQATGSASASGFGDVVAHLKYNVLSRGAGGMSSEAGTRLPTGDSDNQLGSGHASLTPRLIGSIEGEGVGLHAELSYTQNADATFGYSTAVTWAAAPRLTLVGDLLGRRFEGLGATQRNVLRPFTDVGLDPGRYRP